jgi:hypothetical protein
LRWDIGDALEGAIGSDYSTEERPEAIPGGIQPDLHCSGSIRAALLR